MTISEVKEELFRENIKPNKLLGQNFLHDAATLKEIIEAADIHANDRVLEIGPGLGVLTFEIAKRAKKVYAVEKDRAFAEILKKKIAAEDIKNIEIIEGDILKMGAAFFKEIFPYRVVANIPYYLTARLVRKLLEEVSSPESIHLTIQKEVAERIVAAPPHMNLMSLSVQVFGRPKILFPISKKSFWPAPEVDSAFLEITDISHRFFEKSRIPKKLFFEIVRTAFQQKRKVLLNSLKGAFPEDKAWILHALEKSGIRAKARPEALSILQWEKLIHGLLEERDKLNT